MAKVTISRTWGDDGDALRITVDAATSYPDALDQAKRTAVDTFAEALGVTMATETEDQP